MTKYHIKKDGTPGACRAENGNCPLGGADSHFNSEAEAQAEAQCRLEAEVGGLFGERTKLISADEFVENGRMLATAETIGYATAYNSYDPIQDFGGEELDELNHLARGKGILKKNQEIINADYYDYDYNCYIKVVDTDSIPKTHLNIEEEGFAEINQAAENYSNSGSFALKESHPDGQVTYEMVNDLQMITLAGAVDYGEVSGDYEGKGHRPEYDEHYKTYRDFVSTYA